MKYRTINKTLKITLIILIFISLIPLLGLGVLFNKDNNSSPQIHHLAFNTLMAFPDKALDPKNKLCSRFDLEKVTINEFKKILEFLYQKGYCIVDIFDIINASKLSLNFSIKNFPKNKIPLLLSFDNVTYKSSYQNHGEVDKIIIDRNYQLATYTTKKSIQDRIQYDNEFLVILEDYISSHPDFSFNGARGIICFSGENGILGYNTSSKNASSKYEVERVSEVILHLKKLGWRFGSNNYKYSSDTLKSQVEFKKEILLWEKEISPIVDKTSIYSFPNGILDESKLDELSANNFNIFLYNSFSDTPKILDSQILLPRLNVNGDTIRNNYDILNNYFDCKSVYDTKYRTKTFE